MRVCSDPLTVINEFIASYNTTGNETVPVEDAAPPRQVRPRAPVHNAAPDCIMRIAHPRRHTAAVLPLLQVFNESENFYGTSLENQCPFGASVADRTTLRVRGGRWVALW